MTNLTRGRNSVQKTLNIELGCHVKKGVICFYLDIWETDKSKCPAENWMGNLWISVLFRLLNSVRKNYRG